jgi:hypothetical protein
MDEVNQFKEQGDVRLVVPLAPDFNKVLFDLVQITANKSGFDAAFSRRIAEEVSQKVFRTIQSGNSNRNHQQVEVSVSHRPGQLTIRTEIPSLSFNEEIKFRTAETG